MENEHELEGLLELRQVHKEAGNREFHLVSVEEIEEEDAREKDSSAVSNCFEKTVASVLKKQEANCADSRNTSIELVNSVKKNLSLNTSRDSSAVCIYKVPAKLRSVNEKAYTPLLVSIGPIHHGRPELQDMQRSKWRFLDRYLQATSVTIDLLVKTAMDMEHKVRQCYQEPFDHLSSKEFSEMIMLDGIFVTMISKVVEKIITNCPIKSPQESTKPSTTAVMSTSTHLSKNEWVRSEVIHDLLLLENQLPFFVLQNFSKYFGEFDLKLEDSISEFFTGVGILWRPQEIRNPGQERHLLGFIRNYYIPKHHNITRRKIVYNRSATELQEAGVTFRRAQHNDCFDIKFHKGRLELPQLKIDEYTETIFRNMIAFEQCQYDENNDITSYIIFMDSLIDTTKDVDLLAGLGILHIIHGDHERVASLFNNLHKERVMRHEDGFYFTSLCTELNEYSKDYWHQFKAKWFRSKKVLRRDYFSTPWSAISVIAAVILLVLTIVQTVCSIVSIL